MRLISIRGHGRRIGISVISCDPNTAKLRYMKCVCVCVCVCVCQCVRVHVFLRVYGLGVSVFA